MPHVLSVVAEIWDRAGPGQWCTTWRCGMRADGDKVTVASAGGYGGPTGWPVVGNTHRHQVPLRPGQWRCCGQPGRSGRRCARSAPDLVTTHNVRATVAVHASRLEPGGARRSSRPSTAAADGRTARPRVCSRCSDAVVAVSNDGGSARGGRPAVDRGPGHRERGARPPPGRDPRCRRTSRARGPARVRSCSTRRASRPRNASTW